MSEEKQNEEPEVPGEEGEEVEEQYALNYIVNFYNCTFSGPITIKQTGKPKDPPKPPGGS